MIRNCCSILWKSGWTRIFHGAYLLLSLLALATCSIPWDAKPPEDADLLPRRLGLAPEANAFTGLETAAGQLAFKRHPKNGAERDWRNLTNGPESWDPTFADEILAANSATFGTLANALACDAYESPSCTNMATQTPWISRHNDLARLLEIQSRRSQETGDPAGAAQAAAQEWRLGQLLSGHPCDLLEWLNGVACQQAALARFEAVIADARTPNPVLQELQKALDRWPPQALIIGYQQAKRCDYLIAKNEAKDFSQPFASHSYLYKKNMTERMLADYFHHEIENIGRPFSKLSYNYPGQPRPPQGAWDEAAMIACPNSGGKIVFFALAANLKTPERRFALQAQVDSLRIKLALRLYEQRHGQLPESLKALVPEYLKSIPDDPYDGRPMRYSATERKIWAVGRDLVDQGGRARDPGKTAASLSKDYDLVMPVGLQKSKPEKKDG